MGFLWRWSWWEVRGNAVHCRDSCCGLHIAYCVGERSTAEFGVFSWWGISPCSVVARHRTRRKPRFLWYCLARLILWSWKHLLSWLKCHLFFAVIGGRRRKGLLRTTGILFGINVSSFLCSDWRKEMKMLTHELSLFRCVLSDGSWRTWKCCCYAYINYWSWCLLCFCD